MFSKPSICIKVDISITPGVFHLPNNNRRSLLARAAEAMDLPGDALAGLPRIEVVGDQHFYLSNHKGLLEYECDRIAVNGGRVVVRICGDKLVIKAMNADELVIGGRIKQIEFVY